MHARHHRRIHFGLAIVWGLMLPVAIYTGWLFSVAFISAVTIYDTLGFHITAMQSARATEAAEE
jgi:hypothetical protein